MSTGVAGLAQSLTVDSRTLALDTRIVSKALDAEVLSAAQMIEGFTKVASSASVDPDPSKGRTFDAYA